MKNNLRRDSLEKLKEQYAATLIEYLGGAGETALEHAYELGRKAVADGLGVLDIASVHQEALTTTLSSIALPRDSIRIIEAASAFFKECLSPFEITHRSFQEANATLRQLNESLGKQVDERAEALRMAEVNYKLLFNNMNEGVAINEVVYDETGNPVDYIIKDVNPRFEEITGVKRDLAIGKRAAVFYGSDRPPYIDIYAKVVEKGKPAKFETHFVSMDKYFSISAFSSRKGRFATVFSDITERKRAEKEREQALETSNLLLKAAATLVESLDLQDVLNTLADIVREVTGRSRVVILLLNKQTGELTVEASRGKQATPAGATFNLNQLAPQIQQAIYEKKATIADFEVEDMPAISKGRAKAINAKLSLSVPLMLGGEVIGYIGLDEPGERREFTQRDVELVEGIASQASVAIENARLYNLERNIADTLQTALLTVPEYIKGVEYGYLYRSATAAAKVGGDFFDIFELEQDRVCVIVGDVSGKGLQAATLTSLVKNTIRAYAYEAASPAVVMAKVNEAVVKASPLGIFVTVFLGIVDVKSGILTFCSAGHPPAMIKRASKVLLLEGHSPIIGAFRGMGFEEAEATLKEGDVLVLYTDGITEARCDGNFFGEAGLIKTLKGMKARSAKEVPQAVFNKVIAYSSGKIADDVALLALSLK